MSMFYPNETTICFPTYITNTGTHYFIRPGLASRHFYLLITQDLWLWTTNYKQNRDGFYIKKEIEYNPIHKQFIFKNAPAEPLIISDILAVIIELQKLNVPNKIIDRFMELTLR